MRSLLLVIAVLLVAPSARAGEFVPRTPQQPTAETAAPKASKVKSKRLAKRTWRPAAKAKAKKKKAAKQRVKRPMP